MIKNDKSHNFGNSLDNLIEDMQNTILMKKNIIKYTNNILGKIDSLNKSYKIEMKEVNNLRKTIYGINNSKNFLKEDSPSYMWRKSASMLYLFKTREKFELSKETIKDSIKLEKKFLMFFDSKVNYIRMSKLILNNFYSSIKNDNNFGKELSVLEKFFNSIEDVEENLKNMKDKKENLLNLENDFYERVYGKLK